MNPITTSDVKRYIANNIGRFHSNRLRNLKRLELHRLLERKNSYMFRVKNILTAQDLVKSLLDAHLSSQEETIFGDFLEGPAIYINEKVYGGKKSSAEGVDLEFEKDGVRLQVSPGR